MYALLASASALSHLLGAPQLCSGLRVVVRGSGRAYHGRDGNDSAGIYQHNAPLHTEQQSQGLFGNYEQQHNVTLDLQENAPQNLRGQEETSTTGSTEGNDEHQEEHLPPPLPMFPKLLQREVATFVFEAIIWKRQLSGESDREFEQVPPELLQLVDPASSTTNSVSNIWQTLTHNCPKEYWACGLEGKAPSRFGLHPYSHILVAMLANFETKSKSRSPGGKRPPDSQQPKKFFEPLTVDRGQLENPFEHQDSKFSKDWKLLGEAGVHQLLVRLLRRIERMRDVMESVELAGGAHNNTSHGAVPHSSHSGSAAAEEAIRGNGSTAPSSSTSPSAGVEDISSVDIDARAPQQMQMLHPLPTTATGRNRRRTTSGGSLLLSEAQEVEAHLIVPRGAAPQQLQQSTLVPEQLPSTSTEDTRRDTRQRQQLHDFAMNDESKETGSGCLDSIFLQKKFLASIKRYMIKYRRDREDGGSTARENQEERDQQEALGQISGLRQHFAIQKLASGSAFALTRTPTKFRLSRPQGEGVGDQHQQEQAPEDDHQSRLSCLEWLEKSVDNSYERASEPEDLASCWSIVTSLGRNQNFRQKGLGKIWYNENFTLQRASNAPALAEVDPFPVPSGTTTTTNGRYHNQHTDDEEDLQDAEEEVVADGEDPHLLDSIEVRAMRSLGIAFLDELQAVVVMHLATTHVFFHRFLGHDFGGCCGAFREHKKDCCGGEGDSDSSTVCVGGLCGAGQKKDEEDLQGPYYAQEQDEDLVEGGASSTPWINTSSMVSAGSSRDQQHAGSRVVSRRTPTTDIECPPSSTDSSEERDPLLCGYSCSSASGGRGGDGGSSSRSSSGTQCSVIAKKVACYWWSNAANRLCAASMDRGCFCCLMRRFICFALPASHLLDSCCPFPIPDFYANTAKMLRCGDCASTAQSVSRPLIAGELIDKITTCPCVCFNAVFGLSFLPTLAAESAGEQLSSCCENTVGKILPADCLAIFSSSCATSCVSSLCSGELDSMKKTCAVGRFKCCVCCCDHAPSGEHNPGGWELAYNCWGWVCLGAIKDAGVTVITQDILMQQLRDAVTRRKAYMRRTFQSDQGTTFGI
ncbi:unnamed protein product [Amoebophrya sp. A25]|nr:unnamed protein product [Amoebophrya sp. A25]|eukprot:GSA25T00007353001.1